MTSPSSGVKPIVVSTRARRRAPRPATRRRRGGRSRSARPSRPSSSPRAATRRRARARGSRSGGGRSARATRAGIAYVAAAGGQRRVERRVEARDGRQRPGSAARDRVQRGERLGWCSGARSASAAQLAHDAVVDPDRRRKRSPPWTIRCADGVDRPGAGDRTPAARPRRPASAARRCRPRRRPRRPGRAPSLRLLDPALTTRTRTRLRSASPAAPSRARRAVVAVLARVGAVAQALVGHRPGAAGAARVAEPGDAVDDVHHEVEAVHVVEHDHVERRRGRALLLVAADVEVARGSSRR